MLLLSKKSTGSVGALDSFGWIEPSSLSTWCVTLNCERKKKDLSLYKKVLAAKQTAVPGNALTFFLKKV